MSIALCVSFPSYSPCYLSVFIWLNSAWAQHLEPLLVRGVSHWNTAFPSPEQAVLSHSISLPHNTPSLAYTFTWAHSALFRFCLCFPHKSLSELDCMFVSSAVSTEKWEAGGLQRCDSAVQWEFTVFMFAPSGLGTLWVMKWTGGKADAWVWNTFCSLKQF